MYQLERLSEIENYINKKSRADISELSEAFGVSKVTIRRDIHELETQGKLIRAYGGVIAVKNKLNTDIPHDVKITENVEAKKAIGKRAASLIEDNDTVVIDSGTTTLNMVKYISAKNITVITHDLLIAMEVVKKRCAELIVPGGTLESAGYTLIGNQTEEFYRQIHTDKVFIGCDAIDEGFGVSNRVASAITVKKLELRLANKSYLLADSSKFEKKAFYSLCPISRIDCVITEAITDRQREMLENNHVELMIAE